MKRTCFTVVLVGLIGLSSCQKDPLTYRLSTSSTESAIKPTSIKLYLETSVSMRGYVNSNKAGDYKLKKELPYFLTEMAANNLQVDLYTITDTPIKYDKSAEEFSKDLRSGDIFGGKSSMLHNIFKELIKEVDSASVNILVSDCILDLGEENNITERDVMTQEIYSELDPTISVACFKFLSDFNGDWYYDRNNTGGSKSKAKMPYAGRILHNRPFYIWIMGNGDLIKKIHSEGILKGYESVHFYNLDYQDVPVKLLSHPRKGSVSMGEKKFSVKEASVKKPVEITIGLNLSELPDSYQDVGYLTKNMSIEPEYVSSHCEIKIVEAKELKADKDYGKIEAEVAGKNLTHFVSLSLNARDTNIKSIDLVFSKKNPEWLAESHLDDDLNQPSDSIESKTFSFGQLIEAFDRKYKNEELLRVNFELLNETH